MSIATGTLAWTVSRDDKQTITVEVREQTQNLLVGFVQIALVPTGAAVVGTNGADDSEADGEIILNAEAPS